jgi:hypothetical protein
MSVEYDYNLMSKMLFVLSISISIRTYLMCAFSSFNKHKIQLLDNILNVGEFGYTLFMLANVFIEDINKKGVVILIIMLCLVDNMWYFAYSILKNDYKKDICLVCKTEIEQEDSVKLKCLHKFHEGCLNRWVYERNMDRCPRCKKLMYGENVVVYV